MHDPLTNQLLEIENQLRGLEPTLREKILGWVKAGKERQDRIRKSVDELSRAFDTLRVNIKYLMLDLEATQREKQELIKECEELNRILENQGYYADEAPEASEIPDAFQSVDDMFLNQPKSSIFDLPDAENGVIDLPEVGDMIHNEECDHPYDSMCECVHCEAYRDRMRQQQDD